MGLGSLKLLYRRIKWVWFLAKLVVKSKWHIFTRTINFLLIGIQEKIIKPAYVVGYPYHLIIDSGNVCNLRCALCPTGQKKGSRSKGIMSLANFKRIIDELAPYLFTVDLYNWGEPFLNKDIFKMIHYAYNRGIKVNLSSHLNHFNPKMAEELVNSGCTLLFVSLYGASQESASKYQVGTDFNRVMENVRAIVAARKGKGAPFLIWEFGVTKYNEHEIPEAREMARGVFDRLWLAPIFCDMGEQLLKDQQSQFENVREWLPEDEKWSIYSYNEKGRKKTRRNSCSFLYSQSVINWDGSVSPCCAYYDEQYDFGNMFETNFKHIWNNPSYRASRKLIFRGKEGEVKTICNICKRNEAML